MKTIQILSAEDVKKIVKQEVEKKSYKQDRIIDKLYRRMVDLERIYK